MNKLLTNSIFSKVKFISDRYNKYEYIYLYSKYIIIKNILYYITTNHILNTI